MASEETGGSTTVSVPEDLARWLRRAAEGQGIDAQTYLRELLCAHRAIEEAADDGALGGGTVVGVDDEDLDHRLEEVREEYVDLIEDVRERVIQVKRETDRKAPAERVEDLAAELSATAETVEDVEGDLERTREDLADLRADVDAGFDNYEAVLEYLLDRTDDVEDHARRLASATVETREALEDVSGMVRERELVGDLKRTAQREGIASATCESCEGSIRPELLTRPECPYCSTAFVDLEPKEGWLGSARFVTGDRPALAEGAADDLAEDLDGALTDDEDRPDPADVDWGSSDEAER